MSRAKERDFGLKLQPPWLMELMERNKLVRPEFESITIVKALPGCHMQQAHGPLTAIFKPGTMVVDE